MYIITMLKNIGIWGVERISCFLIKSLKFIFINIKIINLSVAKTAMYQVVKQTGQRLIMHNDRCLLIYREVKR